MYFENLKNVRIIIFRSQPKSCTHVVVKGLTRFFNLSRILVYIHDTHYTHLLLTSSLATATLNYKFNNTKKSIAFQDGEEDEFDDLENPMNIKQPEININDLQDKSPEDLLKLTKKGKTLMTFVKVSGNPTRDESEELTKLWQTALWNNHLQAERYMVDDDRAIFMFKDGAQALDAKEYLVEQERCESITIENKVFKGKQHEDGSKDEL